MVKRLTDQEIRRRKVNTVVAKIIKLEKPHGQSIVETACAKYKNASVDKRKAQEELETLEEKIARAKRRLK